MSQASVRMSAPEKRPAKRLAPSLRNSPMSSFAIESKTRPRDHAQTGFYRGMRNRIPCIVRLSAL